MLFYMCKELKFWVTSAFPMSFFCEIIFVNKSTFLEQKERFSTKIMGLCCFCF